MWKLVWGSVADHPLECLNVGFDLPPQPIHEYEPGNSPDTQHPDRHDDFGDLGGGQEARGLSAVARPPADLSVRVPPVRDRCCARRKRSTERTDTRPRLRHTPPVTQRNGSQTYRGF